MIDDEPITPEDQLATFLGELRELMGAILDHEEWMPEELYQEIRAAYDEVGEAFMTADEELQRPGIRERLQAVGLVGNQLRVKISGWQRAVSRFWRQPRLQFARMATGWADVVLGSLAVAVPVVDLIKEFKEVVERAIDDKETDPGDLSGT
jgi:hypothetical protein